MENFCCFKKSGAKAPTQAAIGAGKGKSRGGKVCYGYSLVKGRTNHPMEDFHVSRFLSVNGRELGLFAIFDGHSGDGVPSFLQKNLFDNILNMRGFWINPGEAIVTAFERTDEEILSHSSGLGLGGSTAVIAITMDAEKLWIANIGDSRGVLLRRGQAIQVTVDHEPIAERGRIEDTGGFVSNMPGDVPRVNGQLAVSRAFGDRLLKPHLSSVPAVRREDLTRETDLLILASDGIWKVMNNDEAVEIARKAQNPQTAAKNLTSEALRRECKDDISCIVVRFKI